MSCKLWKEGSFGGKHHRWYECDPDECPYVGVDETGAWTKAAFIPAESATHFDQTIPRRQRMSEIGHEAVHAVMDSQNSETTCGVLGCKPKDVVPAEERVASVIGSGVGAYLHAMGMLKGR